MKIVAVVVILCAAQNAHSQFTTALQNGGTMETFTTSYTQGTSGLQPGTMTSMPVGSNVQTFPTGNTMTGFETFTSTMPNYQALTSSTGSTMPNYQALTSSTGSTMPNYQALTSSTGSTMPNYQTFNSGSTISTLPTYQTVNGVNSGVYTMPSRPAGTVITGTPVMTSTTPVVTRPAGTTMVTGTSTPVITRPAGTTMVTGTSTPVITRPAGTTMVTGTSSPVITRPAGTTMVTGTSAPVVTSTTPVIVNRAPSTSGQNYVVSNGQPSQNYVVSNGQPSQNYVVSNGQPSQNYVVSNGQPSQNYVVSNGQPTQSYVVSNRQPSQNYVITNGQTSPNYVVTNGQTSPNYVVSNGQPGQNYVVTSRQPGQNYVVSNGQPSQSYVYSNGQPGQNYVVTNGQPGQNYVVTNGQPSQNYVVTNGQPSQNYVYTTGNPGQTSWNQNGGSSQQGSWDQAGGSSQQAPWNQGGGSSQQGSWDQGGGSSQQGSWDQVGGSSQQPTWNQGGGSSQQGSWDQINNGQYSSSQNNGGPSTNRNGGRISSSRSMTLRQIPSAQPSVQSARNTKTFEDNKVEEAHSAVSTGDDQLIQHIDQCKREAQQLVEQHGNEQRKHAAYNNLNTIESNAVNSIRASKRRTPDPLRNMEEGYEHAQNAMTNIDHELRLAGVPDAERNRLVEKCRQYFNNVKTNTDNHIHGIQMDIRRERDQTQNIGNNNVRQINKDGVDDINTIIDNMKDAMASSDPMVASETIPTMNNMGNELKDILDKMKNDPNQSGLDSKHVIDNGFRNIETSMRNNGYSQQAINEMMNYYKAPLEKTMSDSLKSQKEAHDAGRSIGMKFA